MVFKWALIVFGVAAVVLFVLTKVIGFLNPPRPGRPAPLMLGRVQRALTLDRPGAGGAGPGPARGDPAPVLICEAQPKASRAHSKNEVRDVESGDVS